LEASIIFAIFVYSCTGCAKNDPTCFYQKLVKSLPYLIIFGTQIAKTIETCKVHSVSTSHSLCQRSTV